MTNFNKNYFMNDLTDTEYMKMFHDISKMKGNNEIKDYWVNFVKNKYSINADVPGYVGEIRVNDKMYSCKNTILWHDEADWHVKQNYIDNELEPVIMHERILTKLINDVTTEDACSNDDYLATHCLIGLPLLMLHTGNIVAYQATMKKCVEIIKDERSGKSYYCLNKEKMIKECGYTDEQLKEMSKYRDHFDYIDREYFALRKGQSFVGICEIYDAEKNMTQVIIYNYQKEHLLIRNTYNETTYKILEFFYFHDKDYMEVGDPVVFDSIYQVLPFTLDKINMSSSESRYNSRFIGNRPDNCLGIDEKDDSYPVRQDLKLMSYFRLEDQGFEFDSPITYKNNFCTEFQDSFFYPMIDKELLAKLARIDDNTTFNYFTVLKDVFADVFYHMRKFAFGIHMAYLVKDPKLNTLYNLSSTYAYNKSVSFFDSKKVARIIYRYLEGYKMNFSDIKSIKDLKEVLFKAPYLTKESFEIKDMNEFFMLTFTEGDIEPDNKTNDYYNNRYRDLGVPCTELERRLISRWHNLDNSIINIEKSDKIQSISDAKEYLIEQGLIVRGDDDLVHLTTKFLNKELKLLNIDFQFSDIKNLDNWLTTLVYFDNIGNSFFAENKDTGLMDSKNFIMGKGNFEQEDKLSVFNLINTLNIDAIASNINKYGFPYRMEKVVHTIKDSEIKGTLTYKVIPAKEDFDVRDYYEYYEKESVELYKAIVLKGDEEKDLNIDEQCSVDFRCTKRFVTPIYKNLKIDKLVVAECRYLCVEKKDVDTDGEINILGDIIKMINKLNYPLKTSISSMRKLVEYHDKLSEIINYKELEDIRSKNKYEEFVIHKKYIPLFLKLRRTPGFDTLDDNLKLAVEGYLQSNCIVSYSSSQQNGDCFLVTYNDEEKGKVSIEVRCNHGNRDIEPGIYKYNAYQMRLKYNNSLPEELERKMKDIIETVEIKEDDMDEIEELIMEMERREKANSKSSSSNYHDDDDNRYL